MYVAHFASTILTVLELFQNVLLM